MNKSTAVQQLSLLCLMAISARGSQSGLTRVVMDDSPLLVKLCPPHDASPAQGPRGTIIETSYIVHDFRAVSKAELLSYLSNEKHNRRCNVVFCIPEYMFYGSVLVGWATCIHQSIFNYHSSWDKIFRASGMSSMASLIAYFSLGKLVSYKASTPELFESTDAMCQAMGFHKKTPVRLCSQGTFSAHEEAAKKIMGRSTNRQAGLVAYSLSPDVSRWDIMPRYPSLTAQEALEMMNQK